MEKQKTNESDVDYYDKCKFTKFENGFEVKCGGRPKKGVLIKPQIEEE